MKVAFLHTAVSHIPRFDKIAKAIKPHIGIEHHVNEQLLAVAQTTGQLDDTAFNKEIRKIRETHEGKIICTCSTYGELCDDTKQVYRLDKPIAQWLVSHYTTIGIAFTTSSTCATSKALLQDSAATIGKPINLKDIDCTDCWQWFKVGDFEQYILAIASRIKQISNDCEVIFLAQASMEGAKQYLTQESYKTVSSPQYGVETYLAN